MTDQPLDLPVAPPEVLALLQDPRLADMKDALPNFSRTQRLLEPLDPPSVGESPFLQFGQIDEERFGRVAWVNEPKGLTFLLGTGHGRGFPLLTERPRFEERGKKPPRRADAWTYSSWLIASPAFVDILRRFDAPALESVAIDWVFSDGSALDGYQFLDIRRRLHAYDYARSVVRVEMENGEKRYAGLGYPRALKRDVDRTVHVFREAFHRADLFMSRELAAALMEAGMQGIAFSDPANGEPLEF
jgi:hypothetical protein